MVVWLGEPDSTAFEETRGPRPEMIGSSGCPPGVLYGGSAPQDTAATADAHLDTELALAMQLSELQQADAETRAVNAAVAQQRMEPELKLCDPVWGELHFLGKHPTCSDKLCFGCCPCCIVGCTGMRNSCNPGRQVSASLDARRVWKHVLTSASLWISVLQVVIFTSVIIFSDGIESLDKNAMIGPHAHFLDKAGAKNTAKIVLKNEWWRLLSPLLLHGGLIHLVINVLVQLRFGMLLEVLWGSRVIFLLIYWITGLYSTIVSCIFLPNTLSVGSSGSICGLVGSEAVFLLITWRQTLPGDRTERNLQLLSVFLTVIFTAGLGFLPLVDAAAHAGGFILGAALGLVIFAKRTEQDYSRKVTVSLAAFGAFFAIVLTSCSLIYLVNEVEVDEKFLNLCLPPDC